MSREIENLCTHTIFSPTLVHDCNTIFTKNQAIQPCDSGDTR